MKNTLTILLVSISLLSGCAIWPSHFDGNEQAKLTDIIELTKNSSICDQPAETATLSKTLNFTAGWLMTYGDSVPNNSSLVTMYNNLHQITDEFEKRYSDASKKPSEFYCKSKISNINEAASKILIVSGKRMRP